MSKKIMLVESQKNGINFDNPDKVLSNMLTKLRIERLQQKLISDTPNNGIVFENWIKSLTQEEKNCLTEILLSQKTEHGEIDKNEEENKKELMKKENDSAEVKILVNVRKFGKEIFSQKLLSEFRSPLYGVPFLIYYGVDNAVIGECLIKSVVQTIYPTEEELKQAGFESREAYNKVAKGRTCYLWRLENPIEYDSPISLREFAPGNGMAKGWKYLYRPIEYINGKIIRKRKAA